MKKMMAAVLAVLMLGLLTGCAKKQEEPNGIVESVVAGYEMINQSGDNRIQVANGEDQSSVSVIQVDMLSETGTLMRPYIFVELGVDFYKIEHSEKDFTGVFFHSMNLLEQMQESETHREIAQLMNDALLPQDVEADKAGFMNMGYVPDPQRKCEIIFTGMTNTGEGKPIRDEVYAFCRFPMMDEGRTPMIMNALVADQNAVYAIAQKVHQAGALPKGVEEWMLRKLGM